jgi:branched-chain amino acid transport system substrate-binding protein
MKRTNLVTSLFVVALAVAGVNSLAAQEVRIGMVAPLSGPAASYGTDILNGLLLAVDDLNAKGGIEGRKLMLEQGDDRGSPKDAANVTQKFASDDKIVALIGGATSTATFGAVPVAQKAGIPFLITLASHPDLTKEGSFIFRNSTTQEAEGPALAKLVSVCLGAKTIGVMNLNNDWAIEMTHQFKKALANTPASIVIDETYNPGDNIDYASKLAKVRATKPDIIWFGSQYNDLALILKQAQQMDLGSLPLVASAGDHTTGLVKVAGSAANNLYLHTLFFEETQDPAAKSFIDAFKKRFNAAPNLFSAQAYEGMLMLAQAVKTGNFTREGTRDALTKMKNFPGVTGDLSIDPNTREMSGKRFTPLVVKDGKFTYWADCDQKIR